MASSTRTSRQPVHIVGAGLAGSECAFQLAERGVPVVLYEMRGSTMTPAHKSSDFGELVCSNSLGSLTDYSAPGQLKWEAERLGSLILRSAHEARVPAGMALAVDRAIFARGITQVLRSHPHIQVQEKIIRSLDEIPRPAVIATGPLTHPDLATSLLKHLATPDDENDFLYFYDAIAPVVDADSINYDIVWRADRFDKGTGDYLNCPLEEGQYHAFIEAVQGARKIEPKDFETANYFSGCLPIEEMIRRGPLTPRFGPMSPKGLRNPRTGKLPFAVVQLRQDNKEGTAYNLVGFQTKMAYPEQQRVFRLIPGLAEAEFLKLGSIHRNLYINTPKKLTRTLTSRHDPLLYFAGQITGVEGYFESTCIGLLVAHFLIDQMEGRPPEPPPRASALGSLLAAITEEKEDFQPTNIHFGLFPIPEGHPPIRSRQEKEAKRARQLENAKAALKDFPPTQR